MTDEITVTINVSWLGGENYQPRDPRPYQVSGSEEARAVAMQKMEESGPAFYARITYPDGQVEEVGYLDDCLV
jgi:hypothetical protein